MLTRPSFSTRRPVVLASTVAALLAGSFAALSANKTWDGGSPVNSLWQTGANWDLDGAPISNDALFFAGTARLTPVNDFAANTLFNGITLNAGAGAFTLSGNALTLTPGLAAGGGTVTGGNATNNSTNTEIVNLAVTLAAGNHTFVTAASSGALNFFRPADARGECDVGLHEDRRQHQFRGLGDWRMMRAAFSEDGP